MLASMVAGCSIHLSGASTAPVISVTVNPQRATPRPCCEHVGRGVFRQTVILTQVRNILECGQNDRIPKLDVIAFYKGDEISPWVLAKIIDAASRGKITEAGEKLLLIPRKTYEKAKKDSIARIKSKPRRKGERPINLVPWPEIRKRDCIPLTSYLPPKNASERKKRVSNSHKQRAPEPKNASNVGYPRVTQKTAKKCDAG